MEKNQKKNAKSAKPKLDGSRGKSKHYKQVRAEVSKVAEAVKDNRAKEEALGDSPDAVEAKRLRQANNATMALNKEQIRALYIEDFKPTVHQELSMEIAEKGMRHEIHESEVRTTTAAANTVLLKAQTDESVARLNKEMAISREKNEVDLIIPRTHIDKSKVELELTKVQYEKGRVAYSEATKDKEVVTQYEVSADVSTAKKASAKIEKVKLEKQLKETKLQEAPDDCYQIDSSADFEFVYKIAKFQYDFRPLLFCVVSFCLTMLVYGLGLPGILVLLCSVLVINAAVLVGAQIQDPLLRFKCGDKYVYKSRREFANVPGKPELADLDVRIENNRRELIKYEGLVRFFDVTRKYVAPVKFLTYEIPFLLTYREKNTVQAVAIGMLQQVITNRVSFCDEETWVRSKIEYNSSNMTSINIDKELMFIPHPDTGAKHGFAVFQETVDVAWGWFMSQKQRSKHVPRPRAVVSQPK